MLRTNQIQRRQAARSVKASRERLTLMHPAFNLREIAKQLLLLEDHLQHHYCDDCIRKHLLTVEAFAEEAKALDEARLYGDLPDELAEMARKALETVTDAQDSDAIRDLAQAIRKQRKALVPMVYDPRGVEARKRVAAVILHRKMATQWYIQAARPVAEWPDGNIVPVLSASHIKLVLEVFPTDTKLAALMYQAAVTATMDGRPKAGPVAKAFRAMRGKAPSRGDVGMPAGAGALTTEQLDRAINWLRAKVLA